MTDYVSRTVPEQSREAYQKALVELKRLAVFYSLLLATSFVFGISGRFFRMPGVATFLDTLIIVFFATAYYRVPLLALVGRFSPFRGMGLLIASAIGIYVFMKGYHYLFTRLGIRYENIGTYFAEQGYPLWSTLVIVSVAPGIFEEIAFRGIIFTGLQTVLSRTEAILIQAAVFSVLHLSPAVFFSHFVIGLTLGWLLVKTNSLIPGMLLHAGWNALVLWEDHHGSIIGALIGR